MTISRAFGGRSKPRSSSSPFDDWLAGTIVCRPRYFASGTEFAENGTENVASWVNVKDGSLISAVPYRTRLENDAYPTKSNSQRSSPECRPTGAACEQVKAVEILRSNGIVACEACGCGVGLRNQDSCDAFKTKISIQVENKSASAASRIIRIVQIKIRVCHVNPQNANLICQVSILDRQATVAEPFAKFPLAPVAGAVNVTATPLADDPFGDVTVACSAAKGVLIGALCGVPAVAVIASANGPAAVFVRLKMAGVDTSLNSHTPCSS
jgi:hypothetical protein